MRPRVEDRGSFTINVLGAGQQELSAVFARRDRPRGEEAARLLGGGIDGAGNALAKGAVTCLECRLDAQHLAGDHVLFLGRVSTVYLGDVEERPLLFHRGSYASVAQ